jgi:hypothetical protein
MGKDVMPGSTEPAPDLIRGHPRRRAGQAWIAGQARNDKGLLSSRTRSGIHEFEPWIAGQARNDTP